MNPPVVRLVDIDGTICTKKEPGHYEESELLPYARDILIQWKSQGDRIIFWTARPEKLRQFTERQLKNWGIPYDQLLMEKPYSHDLHIYDDNNPISHYIVRDMGIGVYYPSADRKMLRDMPLRDTQSPQDRSE